MMNMKHHNFSTIFDDLIMLHWHDTKFVVAESSADENMINFPAERPRSDVVEGGGGWCRILPARDTAVS